MIDVIIPAFNAEHTIDRTIISLINQKEKDLLNVIIVNDNPDSSYEEFINRYKGFINIKEIKNKYNVGPGLSRQNGIDNSDSKYIMFIDADDTLTDYFVITRIVDLIKDNDDVEFINNGIYIESENKSIDYFVEHNGCLHGKVYNREFINKYNIKFNNIRSSEDNAFNNLYLLHKPNRFNISGAAYFYRYNKSSITHKEGFDQKYLKEYVDSMITVIESALIDCEKTMVYEFVFDTLIYCFQEYATVWNYDDNLLNIFKPLLKYFDDMVIVLNQDISKIKLLKNGEIVDTKITYKEFIDKLKKII